MNELEKLRADLVLAGWRIERNSLKNNLNLVDWYAWHPKRPGKLISCLKCPQCGWSVTNGEDK